MIKSVMSQQEAREHLDRLAADEFFAPVLRFGGLAAVFEVKLRLMVYAIPALKHLARSKYLDTVEERLGEHLVKVGAFTPSNRQLMCAARRIRNKLFHSDFEVAARFLEVAIGAPLPQCTIGFVEYGGPGQPATEAEARALLHAGQRKLVTEADTVGDDLPGWLMHMVTCGAFAEAERLLCHGMRLLDRYSMTNLNAETVRE